MHIVRADEGVAYQPPGHHGVASRRMQGGEAGGPAGLQVNLSRYGTGAGVDLLPTAADTVYVLLEGELALTSWDGGRTVLHRLDTVHLDRGELRALHNDGDADAVLLVVLRDTAPA